MLQRIFTVALNTVREAVRARILIGLAGVALGVAIYSAIVGAFTLDDAPRVIADLGAMTVSVFSIIVAVLIGATSLYRELEQKTILPVLARPIRRWEYLIGKYLGTLLVVGVFVLAESGVVLAMLGAHANVSVTVIGGTAVALIAVLGALMWKSRSWRTFGPIPLSIVLFGLGMYWAGGMPLERSLVASSAALSFLEVAIVAAVATLFSAFSTPFLSALLTAGVVAVGRNAAAMARLPERVFGSFVHETGVVLSKIVPNLHVYVPARPLLTGESADVRVWEYVARASVQSLGWAVVLLALAAFLFQRRDFS